MFELMNTLGKNRTPFFFIIDYKMKNIHIFEKNDKINQKNIYFSINNTKNYDTKPTCPLFFDKKIEIEKNIIPYISYKKSFDIVKNEFLNGNTFLVNLTFPTEIKTDLTLVDIFFNSTARYKVLFQDKFVVFSPETFVQIRNGKIYSYPMKGTIDADIEDAANIILNDEKELAEHITIVDLIRNDLGIVSKKVKVNKFRYIDKIITHKKSLLQVSSEIEGTLPENYNENIGTILQKLLPAGSICGAPKPETLAIINRAETYDRGYYTGIVGYFDGYNLDSGVMIRFIENNEGKLTFKSGGGITVYSDPYKEYKELEDKIYVPIY